MWPFLNNVTTTCGCTHCTPSTSICYTGVNLSCIGVNKNDTLSLALQKINALMCVPITNTEIITALGYTPANDGDVVHKTSNETVAGVKTFVDIVKVFGALYVTDSDSQNGSVIINTDANDLPFIQLGTNGMTSSAKFRIDNVNSTTTYQLPNASGTIALEETIKPYKVYTALLTQTGTNAPIAIVVNENTIGAFNLTRHNAGSYYLISPGFNGFADYGKVLVFLTNGLIKGLIKGVYVPPINGIEISTVDLTGVPTDGYINNCSIEIRVYN